LPSRRISAGDELAWIAARCPEGTGAILTATATVVFVATKFTSGAWLTVVIVPALMLLFSRIQNDNCCAST
jgi:hypothetical protein